MKKKEQSISEETEMYSIFPPKDQKEPLSLKYEICLSKKLKENDTVKIGTVSTKVFYLIETDPISLWNHIHTKGNKTSLVRPAYAKLKIAVSKINPILIEENLKKRNQYESSKKLNKEANNGTLGTPESKFKKNQ